MIMKIEDNRKASSWVPAISILEEFIPKIDQKYFIGIKKIVLLDKDYRNEKKAPAFARYVPINRTKFANIEFYLDSMSDLPDEAKKSRMVLSWRILISLAHELYHHRVRGQKLIRRPNYKQEQKDADQWAMETINQIFIKVYPAEKYSDEWNKIEQKIKEYRKKSNMLLIGTRKDRAPHSNAVSQE